MATSGIKTCFNLNPLIKLDGYYLLSDYLEIPNLRARSFRYVGTLITRLLGSARRTEEEDVSLRERRIYLVYGVAGAGGSVLVLGLGGDPASARGHIRARRALPPGVAACCW